MRGITRTARHSILLLRGWLQPWNENSRQKHTHFPLDYREQLTEADWNLWSHGVRVQHRTQEIGFRVERRASPRDARTMVVLNPAYEFTGADILSGTFLKHVLHHRQRREGIRPPGVERQMRDDF